MAKDSGLRGCEERVYEMTHADLPVSCPLPEDRVWDAHPRVYLPVEENGGKAICPYCSAVYLLKDE